MINDFVVNEENTEDLTNQISDELSTYFARFNISFRVIKKFENTNTLALFSGDVYVKDVFHRDDLEVFKRDVLMFLYGIEWFLLKFDTVE